MARLTLIPEADRTPEQQEVCAEAISGIRGRVPAPMIAWLHNPELARRGQKLGELLRFQTTLGPKLSELAILVAGRYWTAHYEWMVHKREALKAGLDPAIAEAIAARQPPVFADAREAMVYEVAHTLMQTRRLPDDLYARAVEMFGQRGVVELVGVLGYYSMVALTLNAFELGMPEAFAPELGAEPGDKIPAASGDV
jgi:4-carboxymuconolactone decarboxylase